jgi:hypothetical protein
LNRPNVSHGSKFTGPRRLWARSIWPRKADISTDRPARAAEVSDVPLTFRRDREGLMGLAISARTLCLSDRGHPRRRNSGSSDGVPDAVNPTAPGNACAGSAIGRGRRVRFSPATDDPPTTPLTLCRPSMQRPADPLKPFHAPDQGRKPRSSSPSATRSMKSRGNGSAAITWPIVKSGQ